MRRSHTAQSIAPMLPELADIISTGLINDLLAKRLPAVGIDQVRAAIAAREQTRTLGRFEKDQLETLTLRKLIAKVG